MRRKQSKWQPGKEKLNRAFVNQAADIESAIKSMKPLTCEHGRYYGVPCPHCLGFAFGDQPRQGSFKLVDREGNEIGGGEFTSDGDVGKIYRSVDEHVVSDDKIN